MNIISYEQNCFYLFIFGDKYFYLKLKKPHKLKNHLEVTKIAFIFLILTLYKTTVKLSEYNNFYCKKTNSNFKGMVQIFGNWFCEKIMNKILTCCNFSFKLCQLLQYQDFHRSSWECFFMNLYITINFALYSNSTDYFHALSR